MTSQKSTSESSRSGLQETSELGGARRAGMSRERSQMHLGLEMFRTALPSGLFSPFSFKDRPFMRGADLGAFWLKEAMPSHPC